MARMVLAAELTKWTAPAEGLRGHEHKSAGTLRQDLCSGTTESAGMMVLHTLLRSLVR